MARKRQQPLAGRSLNARADVPDFRDRVYEPALIRLEQEIHPPGDLEILDQGTEGACTGFGLAAVINKLNRDRGSDVRVSPRMLYEMAKKFDRWAGEGYAGSSCRGAIKGWYNMGACSDQVWPYTATGTDSDLTVDRAKDARNNTIGAYYRVRKNIVDMHAALNEAGAIFASAEVHEGWSRVRKGIIKPQGKKLGGHAFAIVGYDEDGFWVQNSWGPGWGRSGIAHWSYIDWQEHARDAWVVRLALPTPQLWERHELSSDESRTAGLFSRTPRRAEIAGHFLHVDDGQFHDEGRYWSTLRDVQETATVIANKTEYKHLLLYAHGGLNAPTDSARRIAAMKSTFKANGIYPFHFMYDTGVVEELKDIILGKKSGVEARAGGISDWSDRLVERASHRAGRALWREMKSDALETFRTRAKPGSRTMKAFLDALSSSSGPAREVHLVGHSTGAILVAHLLSALRKAGVKRRISSVSLFAPAATVDVYESHYLPLLDAPATSFGIDRMKIYNLDDKRERDDQVAHVYRKSLLYLVSNAFEERPEEKILGMQNFSKHIRHRRLKILYSRGTARGARTESRTHGGFDNDPATLNDVLASVTGRRPRPPFTKRTLDY